MPFNGTGGFTVYTPGNPAVPGTAISSVAFNATMADVATGLANTLTRDGQSPATANIPMGGNKITGLGPATVAGQAVRFEQLPTLATLGAAASGANTDITSMTALSSINGGQLAGFRNRIINGGMQVAQRAAVAITALPQYGVLDRTMFSVAGGTGISGWPTQLASSSFDSGYCMNPSTMSWTAGQPIFTHRLEARNVQDLNSKTISVSFKLSHDFGTGTNFTVRISKANSVDNFGAVTTIATSSAVAIQNNAVTPISVQFALGASDATNGIQVEVFTTAAITVVNKSIYFGDLQLELGSVATPFEQRPYGMELALCQRYYYKSYNMSAAPGSASNPGVLYTVSGSGSGFYCYTSFPVSMRTTPTITTYNSSTGTSGQWGSSGGSIAASASIPGETGAAINGSTVSAGQFAWGHIVASAEL